MNNEETILDPQTFAGSNTNKQNTSVDNKPENNPNVNSNNKSAKKNNSAQKAAYAAGGFVAGAASMFAEDAMASTGPNEEAEIVAEEQHQNAHQESEIQDLGPQESITQEPVPQEQDLSVEVVDVKQVDVDGDGRPDTVVKLDNGIHLVDTTGNGEADIAMADLNGNGQLDDGEYAYVSDEHIVMPTSGEMNASEPQLVDDRDIDVHVIEVGQTDLDGNGIAENVALVEIDGNEVMLVDIDQDNVADVVIADLNGNGQIDGDEIGDITGQGLGMPTMSDGDMYMAQADSEPDYTNDADMGLYEA